ncbi:nucleotide-binding protein [Candidatus Poribacteria bacterium]|nr:nucleotide-binding protein [Candidatus Poribacteria bacterium]
MPKTTIFIGSSSAAKSQAKALVKKFEGPTVEFIPWWDTFTPGRTLLEELDSIRDQVNGALLVFSPESETQIRKQKKQIPNLNVLFEFGYFYGHFGREKVAMIRYGDFYLPSDFGGYIWITGSKFFKRGAVVQVGKRTKSDFTKWIQKL